MYYIGTQPHSGGKKKFYIESHNECMIIVLSYHMFMFTDYVPAENVVFIYDLGNSFVICIGEILFLNLGMLFVDMAKEKRV